MENDYQRYVLRKRDKRFFVEDQETGDNVYNPPFMVYDGGIREDLGHLIEGWNRDGYSFSDVIQFETRRLRKIRKDVWKEESTQQ